MQYNSQGLPLKLAMSISGISKHQYYYQKRSGKPGRKPSAKTKDYNHQEFDNEKVVTIIKKLHSDPDVSYGYFTTTQYLRQYGFIINQKKVYRLMKEHNLLKDKKKSPSKNYAKYRKVQPTRALEVLEMDLKMVWIEGQRKHAYVLNILDTFSRKWLYQSVAFSITQHQVKRAWEHLIEQHLQPNDLLKKKLHIEIRNDNDKRFSAKLVQKFLKENHITQVFTHPYTPQENGHVESFHSILSQHLQRFNFWSINELEHDLILFQDTYNNQRLHGSIAHLSPNDFEILWDLNLIQMSSIINKRTIVFKLKIPRHNIKQYTGNNEPEVCSLLDLKPLDEAKIENKQMFSAEASDNLRYKKSPSVVPCLANI